MREIITWQSFTFILMLISLFATFLNVKKKRVCFKIWLVTNTCWAVYDFSIGAVWQGCLFTVYTGLAIYGIYQWRVK